MQVVDELKKFFAKKSSKLRTLRTYLDKTESSGELYRFTLRKKVHLLSKVSRLQKRVQSLGWEMKLAAIGSTVAALTPFDKIQAQDLGPFVQKDRLENPLRPPLPGYRLKPTSVDLDNDGDYDIVIGANYGYLKLFVNDGSGGFNDYGSLYSSYTNAYGTYLQGIQAGNPSFIDVDGDGDLDLVVGKPYGTTLFYINNGDGTGSTPPTFTAQSGPWNPVTKAGNPFDGLGLFPFQGQRFFFIDYDADGDLDLLLSERGYTSDEQQLLYYENTGSSQFVSGSITGLPPLYSADYGYRVSALLADIDQDGELDLLFGRSYGDITFFKGGSGTFTKQTGPWEPVGKTGNPFDGFSTNGNTYPELIDMDLDGDNDIVIGYNQPFLNNVEPLAYFENKGNGVFEHKIFLDNPLGGAATGAEGAPYFVDIDGDGQLDALLGGKYGTSLTYYKNDNGTFNLVTGPTNPFENIVEGLSNWAGAKPVYVDIDDDGDLDLITGDYYGNITFFLNDGGDLTKQIMDASNPFFSLGSPTNKDFYTGNYYSVRITGNSNTAIDMVDIDNDGDLDLFSGNSNGGVDFFENTGTKQAPYFEKPVDPADNPLDDSHIPQFFANSFQGDTQPRFVDLDNDGDADLVLGGRYYYYYKYYGSTKNGVYYFENIGTPEAAEFTLIRPLLEYTQYKPNPSLIDIDSDGDLDLFVGDYRGWFEYYANENPAPVTTVSPTTFEYTFGSGPTVVDATVTLADDDNDLINKAIIVIQGYQTGDILGFTPMGGITGSFNTSTGTLTLTGKALISTYQDVLRSVTYDFTGTKPPSASQSPGKSNRNGGRTITVSKSMQISVFDDELTFPVAASLAVSLVFPNITPTLATSAGSSTFLTGTPIAIDPALFVADSDDSDLAGATVQISSSTFIAGEDNLLFTSQNGISGSYNGASGILTLTGVASVANYQIALQSIQYQSLSTPPTFTPRTIEFMVDDGEGLSALASKSVNVVNQGPAITASPLTANFNGILTLDLSTISSDPDSNLDLSSFNIIQQPASGAVGSITGTTLTVNFASTNFIGTDNIVVEVFDAEGLQTQATLTITISNQAPIITPTSINVAVQGIAIIDLLTLVSDADNNLDPTTFSIFQQPISGAAATISGTTLTIDYSNTAFAGFDNLIVEVFDLAGARAEATITIQVEGDIVVRNGMSPNGDGFNDYFKIENIVVLGAQNKVTIYNRWGDKVFEVENYDNQTRRFEGKSDGGNDLPSGVYFYKIEFINGKPELKGYLTLKR